VGEGSLIETGVAPSEILLARGGRISLTAGTRGRVFASRLVLDQGLAQLRSTTNYVLEAGPLRVTATAASARVEVALNSSNKIRVATDGGDARVQTRTGVLVARVLPGTAIEFRPAGDASAAFQGVGVVESRSGKYFLVDQTTHVRVELRGEGLNKLVGTRVQVNGVEMPDESPAPGASLVVAVQKTLILPAAGNPGVPAAAGVSKKLSGEAVALIGGLAAASVVGGLYAGGVIASDESPVSR
jgi:hypothetical protein